MATGDARRVAHDLLGEPHVDGRRVSVRQIHGLVENRGVDPAAVADRFELDVADVYLALAYYHDHPEEMRAVATDRAAAIDEVRSGVDWPGDVDPTPD